MLREDDEQCGDFEGSTCHEKTAMSRLLAYIIASVCGEWQGVGIKGFGRRRTGFSCLLIVHGRTAEGSSDGRDHENEDRRSAYR